MKNKTKKLQLILLAALMLAFLYNSYFLIPHNYRQAAEKYLTKTLYLPEDVVNFYGKRIIVFAPHCDDETLGCAGAIQKALTAGARVYVVLITNGDGFKYAAEAEFKNFKLHPKNYIKFAYIRQDETLKALSMLGVENKDVFFLGYPDRGIAHMWRENWSKSNPYFSPFTQTAFSPYANSFSQNTEYCGENLLADIEKILSDIRPDIVYVPHTMDFHVDHWSTNCFVNTAINQLSLKDKNGKAPLIYTYLVHRGNWPVPSGKHLNMPLIPPNKLQNIGTEWKIMPLDGLTTEIKYEAMKFYKSQLMLMKNYLFSFARQNELFGIYPTARLSAIYKAVIINPGSDTLRKKYEKDSSIEKIYARKSGANLLLKIETFKKISKNTKIKIYMTCFSKNGLMERLAMEYTINSIKVDKSKTGITANTVDNFTEIIIPLNAIKDTQKILLGAEAYHNDSLVDRTAYRMIEISDKL